MITVLRILLVIVVLGIMEISSSSQTKILEKLTTVSYCELVNNASKYANRVVRVKGVYRSAFENSQLYCSDCLDLGKITWVEFEESCRKSKMIRNYSKGKGIGGVTTSVVLVGTFSIKGQYGHMNAYDYLFTVSCVESAKTLFDGRTPTHLPSQVLAKTHCN